jgi:hypothetical protein
MKEEKQFKPRAMYKWQLAQQYHPTLDRDSAVTALRRWMARNDELMRELRATGYNHRCKELTALQVQLIVEYLGEP